MSTATTLNRATNHSRRPIEAKSSVRRLKAIVRLLSRLKSAHGATDHRHAIYLGL